MENIFYHLFKGIITRKHYEKPKENSAIIEFRNITHFTILVLMRFI